MWRRPVARIESRGTAVGSRRLLGPTGLGEHVAEQEVRRGEVRPQADRLARRVERLLEVPLARLQHAQVHVDEGGARSELARALEVTSGRRELPARHQVLAGVHPCAAVARALAQRVLPVAQRILPLPGAVPIVRHRCDREGERDGGEQRAGTWGDERRTTMEQPREQHREAERRGDVGPVIVDDLGEGHEGRLGRERDEEPRRRESHLRVPPDRAQREPDPGEQDEQRQPGARGEQARGVGIAVVHRERVRPDEETHVVEESRPLADEPDPRSDPGFVAGLGGPRGKDDGPVRDVGGGEQGRKDERQRETTPVHDIAPHGRVPRPIAVDEVVDQEHHGQGDGDRLRQEREGEEHCAERPAPADEGEERPQVESAAEERRARPHEVDRLAVEGRQGKEERGRRGWDASFRGRTAVPRRPPHVVADDHEDEQGGGEVQHQVEDMPAPRLEPRDRIVHRVRDQQHGTYVHLRVLQPERVGVREEARDVA